MLTVTILRRDKGKKESYEQTFSFEDKFRGSVVDLLHALNARETLEDASGAPAKRICFECSCETGSCGACAMLVNGTPMLACDAHLPDALRDGMLHLAPLTAFPCVCDLQVDRNVLRGMLGCGSLGPRTPLRTRFSRSACIVACAPKPAKNTALGALMHPAPTPTQTFSAALRTRTAHAGRR